MSRVGNRIINIPTGVTVNVDGNVITVKGPKGELSTVINKNINVEVSDTEVKVTRKNDNFKNFHGTANANIKNMIVGVTEGYSKKLEAVGVGYRFQIKGKELVVSAGYSNPVKVKVPEGITLESPSNTELFVKGIDKLREKGKRESENFPRTNESPVTELIVAICSLIFWGALTIGAIFLLTLGLKMMIFGK